ncbi:MAG: leucine-rich repeat protein [Candidatus Methanomethylophilaceae archaeon]|nr:leucine-rich repeat protein [Candidatus Methanomethylophilaceae archaeon]
MSGKALAMLGDLWDGKAFSAGGISYEVASAAGRTVSITGYEGAPSAVPSTVAYKGWTLSVESVGSKALLRCTSLTSADLSNAKTLACKSLGNCTSITDISFSEGLESIGSYALTGLSFYDSDEKLAVTSKALRGHSFSETGVKMHLIS